ncbi:MAG: hypothetical protein EYC62_03820 [Alphaproteobacteria bacterium]|nr:MAG: hypothetical protein EYC62_03820 [Alphaproteobacteria bacterium]
MVKLVDTAENVNAEPVGPNPTDASMLYQMDIHLPDSISLFLRRLIANNTQVTAETAVDDLVDGFLSPSPSIRLQTLENLVSLLGGSDSPANTKRINALRVLHGILNDNDLRQVVGLYALTGHEDSIHKLFGRDELSEYGLLAIRSIFKQAAAKCDTGQFLLENSLKTPDAWWDYSPEFAVDSATDPFDLASAQGNRHRAFTAYRQNGGIFITNEALAVMATRAITNHVETFLQNRFPNDEYPGLADTLMTEFLTTNADVSQVDPGQPASYVAEAIQAFTAPDYDACGKGLTTIMTELSRRAIVNGGPETADSDQALLRQDIADLNVLHTAFHRPDCLKALCDYVRVDKAPIGSNTNMIEMGARTPFILASIKSDIRTLATDHRAVTILQRSLDQEKRRAAKQAAERPEPPKSVLGILWQAWRGNSHAM